MKSLKNCLLVFLSVCWQRFCPSVGWFLLVRTLAAVFLISPCFIPGLWADAMMDNMMPSMKEGGILLNPTPDLGGMELMDVDMQMVMPLALPHMPMSMLMLHGYGFGEWITEDGARGRTAFSGPDMFMADLGTTLDDHQYLNLDVMLTSDLWAVPAAGIPELLQIGEDQADGQPFIDAQHPHSSPIMGLTLSDTFTLNASDKSALKLFAAPRGESTDGPIAFMHRITGMVNPDVPLGHHIGQDVGHVTSTVLGESLKLGSFHIESSVFNGSEPNPTQMDLPIGPINSIAFRGIEEFAPNIMFMASYAWVGTPEPGISNDQRYSASLYTHTHLTDTWTFRNTLIYGGITNIDHASQLSSFLDEFLFSNTGENIFARIEVLQRTPNQLDIPDIPNGDGGQWVDALTLGYSHQLEAWDGWELRAGFSVTNDQLPGDYQAAYSGNPFTYKVFFQLGGTQSYQL
jgi:hypothetical protein